MAVALVIFARWDPVRCFWPRCCSAARARSGRPCIVGVTSGYYLFNAAPYVAHAGDHHRDQLGDRSAAPVNPPS